MKLSDALRKVADHEEPGVKWDWKSGMCSNIYRNFGQDAERRARDYMSRHPEFSGNRLYPIASDPDHLHGVAPEPAYGDEYTDNAFLAYMSHDEPDMYTGCYGKKRRETALYLCILFAAEGDVYAR